MSRLSYWAMVVALLLVVQGPSSALDIGGTLIVDYTDREGDNMNAVGSTPSMQTNAGHGQIRFNQASLRLTHDLSDYNRFGASLTATGPLVQISDAWLEFGGVPLDGSISAGRFYKPLGAPLQTVGLSYPALLYHSGAVTGLKMNQEYYPWRWEVGFVSSNPLSATGTFISNTAAFGRPATALANINTNNKEAYLFLGWRDGGDWGALDVNAGVTYGTFSQADRNTLNALNILTSTDHSRLLIWDLALDYTYGPYRLSGEYIRAEEGKYEVTTYNIHGAYRTGTKVTWLVGFDKLDNNATNRPITIPASWRRQRLSYGVQYELTPAVQFRLEYEENSEDVTNFGPRPGVMDRGSVPNDGVIFQILATF